MRLFRQKWEQAAQRILFLAALCFVVTETSSQVYYTTNPYYLRSRLENTNFQYNYPDTSVLELSNFMPRNFLGNIGLASPDYILNYGTAAMGFRLFKPPYQHDRFHDEEVEYYRSLGPYAKLEGIAGSKQLQIFNMIFTHTYRQRLNVAIRFRRYTSTGFYRKQQTYTNNFYLSSNYNTKNERLGYNFFVLNNSNKSQENGGIRDTLLNDSTVLEGKDLMFVRLNSANRDNRETSVMLNPWLRLNKQSDTVSGVNHFIHVKSKFLDQSFRYSDNGILNDAFYNRIYLDTINTWDSSHVRKFTNEVLYSLSHAKSKFGGSVGFRNEISQVYQRQDSLLQNNMVTLGLLFHSDKKDTAGKEKTNFNAGLNAVYIVNGSNAGNYKAEINSMFTFNVEKKRILALDILMEQRNPDYFYNRWVSNHFMWLGNGFKAQQRLQARVGLNLGKIFKFSLFSENLTNYIYFDEYALPKQLNESLFNLGVTVGVTKIFFKHLGISAEHTFQNTSAPKYLRIPANITTAKLFFAGNLFKGNTQLHFGVQAQMYEAFVPYNYMPATQAFYLQDKIETETYPFVDAYLNVRIRPVTVFLKVENVLQGYTGSAYYFVPGYYQPDRAFRFGISWSFFD